MNNLGYGYSMSDLYPGTDTRPQEAPQVPQGMIEAVMGDGGSSAYLVVLAILSLVALRFIWERAK
jgi:hypothetical protein